MPNMTSVPRRRPRDLGLRLAAISVSVIAVAGLDGTAQAAPQRSDDGGGLTPGNLLISRTVYDTPSITRGVTVLPPGCVKGCVKATHDGTFPGVWDNDKVDASFGVTSKIYLDQITPLGLLVGTIQPPVNTTVPLAVGLLGSTVDVPVGDLVTSFPSKSEIALNQSTNRQDVSFMGYVAPDAALDVSNANTPGVIDPTNPVPGTAYRVIADINSSGQWSFTETNAYSGNNGRAAIRDNTGGADLFYTAGNAGNGGNPQPNGVVLGAGAQVMTPSSSPEAAQLPGPPTPVGNFNISELGLPPDKIGKDDNFRGLTISGNVLYYTKGSGGNGVNTVYFVDTTGTACPHGTGLPAPDAPLPSGPFNFSPKTGLPTNMCILKGFPTTLAKNSTDSFPFGIWFADAHTVYVADEGSGDNTYSATTGRYTADAAQTRAGLQKWVFDPAAGAWKLAYTLQTGLNLGVPYSVAGYPAGNNPTTGLPWAPATDGLRNITGEVHRDGVATIWAVTSTVSGSGDQGGDPNKVLAISDSLRATTPTARFRTVKAAGLGEALRGVSFTPGTQSLRCDEVEGC